MRNLIGALSLTALACLPATAGVRSDFTVDDEGWTVVSVADNGPYTNPVGGPYSPAYSATGGNPGGFISSGDPDSVTWWFQAPTPFLGDQSLAYGTSLSFDLSQTPGGDGDWVDADVALVGAGLTLVRDAGANPAPDTWTHFEVALGAASDWKLDDLAGGAPTEAQFKAVLGSLEALRIRGEFSYGADVGRLDNVQLGRTGPISRLSDGGQTLWLLVGATALLGRRRLSGRA